jgi:hypothetical protein
MKRKIAAIIIGASLWGLSGMASAQFGGLGKIIPGASSGSSESVSPEGIINKYVSGQKYVLNAESKMLEALKKKDQADLLALQAQNLTEGATEDALKEAAKTQTEGSQALEAEFKGKNIVMDAESKEKFVAGLADLGRGISQYADMRKEVSGFTPSPTSLGGSAKSALYIVKTLPGSITSLSSTLKSSIDFATANNIPIPKEAADATSAI